MQETIEQFLARGGQIQKIATVDMVAAVTARQSADVSRIRALFERMDREDREMEIALEKERAKRAYNLTASVEATEEPAAPAPVPGARFAALRATVLENKRIARGVAAHFRNRSGIVALRTCACGESFPFTPGETECPTCLATPAAPSLFDEESVAA
jgi:hypothetical protein